MESRVDRRSEAQGLKHKYVEVEPGVYAEVIKAQLLEPNEARILYGEPAAASGLDWVELKRFTAPQDLFLDGIKLTQAGSWAGNALFRLLLLGKRSESYLPNPSAEYGRWGTDDYPENWVKATAQATWEATGRNGGRSLRLACSGVNDGWVARPFAIPGGMNINYGGWFKGTAPASGLQCHFIYYSNPQGTAFVGEEYHQLATTHADWTQEMGNKAVEYNAKSAKIWLRQNAAGSPSMEMDDAIVYTDDTIIYPASYEETVNSGNYVAFPYPIRVEREDLICVMFRSTNAGDGAGDTLELNELRMRLANPN